MLYLLGYMQFPFCDKKEVMADRDFDQRREMKTISTNIQHPDLKQ